MACPIYVRRQGGEAMVEGMSVQAYRIGNDSCMKCIVSVPLPIDAGLVKGLRTV